ncbi:hypothetical protein OF846_002345 [Rhodotorula toruloides]|nr:hypothetical protein OF846_002345 [Rhodotorula toruloides]
MPKTLTRSLSRPLADLSNLLWIRSKAAKTDTVEQTAGPPPLLALPEITADPFAPFDLDEPDDHLDAPFDGPTRPSVDSHLWKECTPIPDDPMGEALAEESFARRVASRHTAIVETEDELSGSEDEYEDADDSSEFAEPVSPSFEDESAGAISTPNTSLPHASPDRYDAGSPWASSPHAKGEAGSQQDGYPFPHTSTPPRPPAAHFVELIETCPTPPSSAAVVAEERRRSLLVASGLGIDCEEDSDGEDSTRPSSVTPRSPSRIRSRSRSPYQLGSRAASPDSLDEEEQAEIVEPPLKSYPPSLYPDEAHFDTYTRRPRHPRASVYRSDDEDPLPFSELTSTSLVNSLLALRQPHNDSTSHIPAPPAEDPSTLPAPRHVRPHHARERSGAQSPAPFSDLVSPTTAQSRRDFSTSQPFLRAQQSNSTLFSWDLAHLPAPRTPRERPFRVRTSALFLPTSFLGGGKGTGLYGDVCGAVERKVEEPKKKERRRSMPFSSSLASLSAVFSGDSERSARRNSGFGIRSASVAGHAIPEDAVDARPWTPSLAPQVDEFAVLAAEKDVVPPKSDRLKRSTSLRRSLNRWTRRASWAPSTALDVEEEDERRRERQERRKSGLSFSLFRPQGTRPAEDLDHWVSVVFR